MTNPTAEGGSKRHPVGKGTESPIMLESAGAIEFAYTHFRSLDPVKAAALTAAVQAWPNAWVEGQGSSADQIIILAQEFEAWLDPKAVDRHEARYAKRRRWWFGG